MGAGVVADVASCKATMGLINPVGGLVAFGLADLGAGLRLDAKQGRTGQDRAGQGRLSGEHMQAAPKQHFGDDAVFTMHLLS
jgi:hypothetical protein